MSQASVEREIALKRTYAARLEARANDPTHVFTTPDHREQLAGEAARVRDEATREEQHLTSHRRPH